MNWCSAFQTHRGNRREHNEDAVCAAPQRGLWAVADGMGGHNAGAYASGKIVERLQELELDADLCECVDRIEDSLLEVNDQLRYYAQAQCGGQTVGSTVVTTVVRGHVGVVLWAGDSRLYRLRDKRLDVITRDHNPVADLLDVGGVTDEQALQADTHIITRAIGGQTCLQLDIAVFDVACHDTLLLCSDGLYREIEPDCLVSAMQLPVHEATETLLQMALEGPARDNISAVIARAGDIANGA